MTNDDDTINDKRPVIRNVYSDTTTPRQVFGLLSDRTEIYGDLVKPPAISWEANT